MSPNDLAHLTDEEIVEFLVELPASKGARALASDAAQAAFLEIRRRYAKADGVPKTPSGRSRSASSVEIDPERFRAAWYRRRLTQVGLGEMIGKSSAWVCAIARRSCCSYFVLDQIASELGEVTDDLVYEVASDRERMRLTFAWTHMP